MVNRTDFQCRLPRFLNRMRVEWVLVILSIYLAPSLWAAPPKEASSDAVWDIVMNQCLPNTSHLISPCIKVSAPPQEYVLFKDRNGSHHLLVIPTRRILGKDTSDDPQLMGPTAINYLAKGWEARDLLSHLVGRQPLPRKAISLALNSYYNRQERELHIHVDCLDKTVFDLLEQNESTIGRNWKPFPKLLAGRNYNAMRIETNDLRDNPFDLIIPGLPPGDSIGEHTVVVIGWTYNRGVDGFVLLDGKVDVFHGTGGHGEDLQSHGSCNIPDY